MTIQPHLAFNDMVKKITMPLVAGLLIVHPYWRTATAFVLLILLYGYCVEVHAAETRISNDGSSAVTAGSIRNRELLLARDEEIQRLRRALAEAEARIDNLQSPSAATAATRQSDAVIRAPEPDVSIVVSYDSVALSDRWHIAVTESGPENYIDLTRARLVKTPLPNPADCQTFAAAVNSNSEIGSKIKVNGFPITSFWVLNDNGKLGVCRINRTSSGQHRAVLAKGSPSRSDKAIVPMSR